ncbi:RNA polymerase sigma-D factor [[Clostridium] ultunense Esp]|nr:RNA polymerase sigma-D factor [[Clostridium] ultunense Esp]
MADYQTAVDLKLDWKRLKEEGDKGAEERIVEHFLYLVDKAVRQIAPSLPTTVRKEDLRSFGLMGLLDAVRKFDPDRNLQFVTYASWRIRGAILDGLRENDFLPRSLREKAKRVEEAYAVLEQEKLSSVTDEDVANYLGITTQELNHILQESSTHFYSIDESFIDEESTDKARSLNLIDEQTETPEERVARVELRRVLTEAIETLPEKERLVLSLFYFEELSFTEVAQVLSLSPSRISQLHSKAMIRLRTALGKMKGYLR